MDNIKRSISKSKKKKKTENLSSSKANSKTKVKDNAMKSNCFVYLEIRNRLKVSPASYYEINDINK